MTMGGVGRVWEEDYDNGRVWEEDYDKGRDVGGCGRKIMTRGGMGEGVGGRS